MYKTLFNLQHNAAEEWMYRRTFLNHYSKFNEIALLLS